MQNQEASNERDQHSKHFWQGRHLFMSIIDTTIGFLKITVLSVWFLCHLSFSPPKSSRGRGDLGMRSERKPLGNLAHDLAVHPETRLQTNAQPYWWTKIKKRRTRKSSRNRTPSKTFLLFYQINMVAVLVIAHVTKWGPIGKYQQTHLHSSSSLDFI